jgi:hypothetical protein
VNRAVVTLLLILVVQCGLVAVVYRPPGGAGQGSTMAPGARPFDPGSVHELRITNESGGKALLQKIGGQWLVAGLAGLPADQSKVQGLLETLAGADYSWPVADSAAARQRFRVADYGFVRRVDVWAEGQELSTLYLGTSPGFRKIHARVEGSDAIYSIAFNAFDAPARGGAWVDRKLLQVRTPVRISSDAYSVSLEDGEWRAGNGEPPDEREMLALLGALRSLQVEGVADGEDRQELVNTEPDLILDIESLAGDIRLQMFSLEGQHYIRSSEYPFYFQLSAFDFDRLTGIDFVLMSGSE